MLPFIHRVLYCNPILVALYFGVVFLQTMGLVAGTHGGALVAAKLVGQKGNEVLTDVRVLPNETVVVCGYTTSVDWVPAAGGYSSRHAGSEDAFVAIYSEKLDSLVAFTFFGGKSNDRAVGVVQQTDGTIVVVGTTTSNDLPIAGGFLARTYTDGIDGFICAFSPTLTELRSASYIPGTRNDVPLGIEVDSSDYIHVFGTTNSNSGFLIANAFQISNGGDDDGFLMRIAPNLTGVINATYFGGESKDAITAVCLLANGDVAFTGYTASANFPTYPKVNPQYWWQTPERPYDFTYNSGTDAFVGMFSADGGRLYGCSFIGGSGEDIGTGIHIDAQNVLAVTGSTTSADFPTMVPTQAALKGTQDIFLVTLSSDCRQLLSSTYFGGSGIDKPISLGKISTGVWCISASTTSNDIPSKGFGANDVFAGVEDILLVTMSAGVVQNTTVIGWAQKDVVHATAIDNKGDVIVVGESTSTRIRSGSNSTSDNQGAIGTSDGLLLKHAYGELLLVEPQGGSFLCINQPFTISWQSNGTEATETYDVQVTSDFVHWSTVLEGVQGTSVQARFAQDLVANTPYKLRVIASRGHTSEIEEEVQFVEGVKIKTLPTFREACMGKELSLVCSATGSYLKYQWRRNGKNILGESSSVLSLNTNNPNVAGSYDVVVAGGCNQTEVSSATIVALETPINIIQQPIGGLFNPSASHPMRVSATGVDLRFQWYLSGEPIPGATDSVWLLNPIAQATGLYFCEISSTCSKTRTQTVGVYGSTSVQQSDRESSFSLQLQPNPAEKVVEMYIPFEDAVIHVLNENGAVILKNRVRNLLNGASVPVNVSSLAQGVYTVLVIDEYTGNTKYVRFVKL